METRKIVALLRKHGWYQSRSEGSHTWWVSPDGKRGVSVPTGHKTVSPGVVRKVMQALGLAP